MNKGRKIIKYIKITFGVIYAQEIKKAISLKLYVRKGTSTKMPYDFELIDSTWRLRYGDFKLFKFTFWVDFTVDLL